MANVLANLARVRSATTGTGSLALGAAVTGALTFTQAGVSDGSAVTYAIEDYDNNNLVTAREIGRGTFSGSTLTRDSVYASTNAGSKINCSGRQHVFITAAKEDFDSFLTTAAASSAYQPLDADLTTLAASITTFGHSLVDDADAATARSTLGLGTMATETAANYYTAAAADAAFLSPAEGNAAYQPLDADLTAIAALVSAANKLPYATGAETWALTDLSSVARTLLAQTTQALMRSTGLGLGTAATQDTGTSGATLPFLNGTNTWSGAQTVTTSAATAAFTVTSSASFCLPFSLISTNADAIGGPGFQFFRDSSSPAANDDIGFFNFRGNTSAAAGINYVQLLATIMDPTAASEDSRLRVNVYRAGTQETSLTIKDGCFVGSPTGFAMGAGTLNATALYEQGTALSSKYGALASANVWTAAQTVRIDNATTNAVTVGATLSHTTTGTPANGIGVSLAFEAETTAGNNEVGATIEAVVTDVTSTSEDFDLVFKTMAAGAAAAERMRIKSTNSILCGTAALATNATDGFLYVPTCAGTPTGAPTAHTGMAPIVVDTTNNKLYFYSGGAWRDAGP